MDCLDFPLIEQDSPPVELVVHLTADPCPEVKWYINDTLITDTTSNFEVYEYIQLFIVACIDCVVEKLHLK